MQYRDKKLNRAEQTKTAIATSQIKIIGAGFGRTGTLSIKTALEELGFGPCYHMTEVSSHPGHAALWDSAARGETVDWREIFAGYQSTVDWPGCTFYKELMQTYPDAKVLLTVRDPEKWYESAQNTIYQVTNRMQTPPIRLLLRLLRPNVRQTAQMINTLIWEGTFNGNFEDKQQAIEIFNQHIEDVKKYVPPERLLIYNAKEGWEPLCAFLGVEVPKDKPFPHLNDRDSFTNRAQQRSRTLRVGVSLVTTSIIVFFFFILRRLGKTRKRH
jgi:hypothetical protein